MKKEEKLAYFLEEEVQKYSHFFFKETMDFFFLEKEKIIQEFVHCFQLLCQKYHSSSKAQEKVAYVQYSLIYTKVLSKEPFYYLEFFNRNFYFDGFLSGEVYVADWLYNPFFAFEEKVYQEAKKYVGAIQKPELEQIFLIEIKRWKNILKFIFSEAVPLLMVTKEYQNLAYEQQMAFQLGEYRGNFEEIFVRDELVDKMGEYMNGILST